MKVIVLTRGDLMPRRTGVSAKGNPYSDVRLKYQESAEVIVLRHTVGRTER